MLWVLQPKAGQNQSERKSVDESCDQENPWPFMVGLFLIPSYFQIHSLLTGEAATSTP
jgi:hypothetical protein